MYVAVYGTLRENAGNHYLLLNSTLLGTFQTSPNYTLFSLGSFPGIAEEGDTSITMEVYEIDEKTAQKLDNLEGYHGENNGGNLYNKRKINTPFGEAFVYVYNGKYDENQVIPTGDWFDHVKEKFLV